MPFSKLGLSAPIVQAVTELGYKQPTQIQQKAIPAILSAKDVIATAQTGTGKTAAFVLPILDLFKDAEPARPKRVRALIMTPTRELAIQINKNIEQYSQHLNLTSLAMYGGVDDQPQKEALIDGVDILVATPGRLLDMYTQRAIHFDETEILVLDEADRMLDMGFINDINKIVERLPVPRQNLLFSATMSQSVRFLAKTLIEHPVHITIKTKTEKPKINQCMIPVDKDIKSALLSHLIQDGEWTQALIFIETKRGAAKLVSQLEKRGIEAEAFHGGRSQAVREQLLEDFKDGNIQFLVTTGIAARGIDIDNLTRVVNYDLPDQADDYVHRIGRTGRAGTTGEAISLLSRDDFRSLCYIEQRLNEIIPRKVIAGFEPKKEIPPSDLTKSQSGSKPKSGSARRKPRA